MSLRLFSTLPLKFRWAYDVSLELPWRILSCYIFPVVLLTLISTYFGRAYPSLADAPYRATNILQDPGIEEEAYSITHLELIERVLMDMRQHTLAVRVSRNKWTAITPVIDTIHVLLQDFRIHLQCARESRIPGYLSPILRELCTHIDHVLLVLHKSRKVSFLRCLTSRSSRSLLEEIEQCSDQLKKSLTTLEANVPKRICRVGMDELCRGNVPLDICESATPQRYRLLDCAQLVEHNSLCIYEFSCFPQIHYAAISYVWRGNNVGVGFSTLAFSVAGAEDGDPISADVLYDACVASCARGATYLWLDRLSILQTSKEDKKWQIREMHRIYASCVICIVIPGGVRRLVPLDEETSWIHRGWTLQEALAPPSVLVLFAWKLGSGSARAGDDSRGEIEEVVSTRSAMTSLSLLADACTAGSLSVKYRKGSHMVETMVETKVFSSQPDNWTYNDIPFWRPTRRVMSPNISALAIAMSKDMDDDAKEYAIWHSAFMRTSSRPVDMVFSIMGLFGVTLDTSAFGKNDRIGATIALAREILKQGRRASWLGVSFHADPCPQISTFPTFPRTRVAGKALVKAKNGYQEASKLMESEYPCAPALVPMPQGSMDADGYLSFSAKAVRLVPSPTIHDKAPSRTNNDDRPKLITATDGSTWAVCDPSETDGGGDSNVAWRGQVFAVLLGFFVQYFPGGSPAHDANNVRAMLVETHAAGKFHVRSYFMLSIQTRGWAKTWAEHSFSLGGPRVGDQHGEKGGDEDDEMLQEVASPDLKAYFNIPTSRRPMRTLEEQLQRKSRWAIPQHVLEKQIQPNSSS